MGARSDCHGWVIEVNLIPVNPNVTEINIKLVLSNMSMEQYLLQLPKRLAQEVRETIAKGDAGGKVEMISSGRCRSLDLF